MPAWREHLTSIIDPAVARSKQIERIVLASGAIARMPSLVREHFGPGPAILIADRNTMAAAGDRLAAVLGDAGIEVHSHIFPCPPRLKASVENGLAIKAAIEALDAIPLAVGSGVINDLVKFAAFEAGRPYGCIATAASMDGYSSAGSPLSDRGFKITIPCRAPAVIAADLDVIAAAPPVMAGWGFGDLAGKVPAGADWIVADALGVEDIDQAAWPLVHDHLREQLTIISDAPRGGPEAMATLFTGLVLTGLAMEFHGSSRPASGADHQIAHVWEMENLMHASLPVSHGACVSVGCVTVLALYDWLLDRAIAALDVGRAIAERRGLAALETDIISLFGNTEVARRAAEETRAKFADEATLKARLVRLKSCWPVLRARLRAHLVPGAGMVRMLAAAGAANKAGDIGVDPAHHRETVARACFIRRRYTILDLLAETGLLGQALDAVFARGGPLARPAQRQEKIAAGQ